jgi:uncharacterized membrane protein
MHIEHWLIGPQLIGFIFMILGYIQTRFPPKRINNFYGYRMPSAMKNQETWDEANSFSAKYMVKLGLIMIIAGFVLIAGLSLFNLKEDARMALQTALLIVSSITLAILLMAGTEKHMSKVFDNKPL